MRTGDSEDIPPLIASAAKQSTFTLGDRWIASRSLSSGARSRDPSARDQRRRRQQRGAQPLAADSPQVDVIITCTEHLLPRPTEVRAPVRRRSPPQHDSAEIAAETF